MVSQTTTYPLIRSRRFWLVTFALLIGGVLFAPFYILLAIHPFLPTSFRVVPDWYQFLVLSQFTHALLFSHAATYLLISLLGIGVALMALLWARPHWVVRVLLVLALLAIIAFPWVFRYQPALVAAPGYTMRLPTQPGLLDGVVKLNQSIAEIQPCAYTLLGWSADAMLYYQAQCGSDPTQTWAIAPDREANARLVASPPTDLFVERAPISVFDLVRAETVSPTSEEPNARRVFLREGSLISHDGSWIALIAWHLYGPEDVVIISGGPSSPTSQSPANFTPTLARSSNLPGERLLLLRGDVPPYELWTVRANGVMAERVPIPGLELRDDVVPSPDGKTLLLIRSETQNQMVRRRLEIYDVTTGQISVLVNAPSVGTGVQEARWSPLGDVIAFTSDALNGQSVFDIWLVNLVTKRPTPLTRFPVPSVTPPVNKSGWFSVPPVEAAGIVFPGAQTLQWSPNGKAIAFVYLADSQASSVIKVIRATDGDIRSTNIPVGPFHRDEFTWTPDGEGFLYIERLGNGRSRTWRTTLAGAAPMLVAERSVIGPWSWNRNQMAFNVFPPAKRVDADSEIWLFDYGSNQSRLLVRTADLDAVNQEVGQPGWYYLELGMSQSPWTPDSRWLGFVAQRANQTGYATWIIATDDSQLFKVADGEIIAWLP